MTSLSELVSYRTKIYELHDKLTLDAEIRNRCNQFSGLNPVPLDDKSKIEEVLNIYSRLTELNSTLEEKLNDIIQLLDYQIDAHGKLLEQDSEYISKFNEHAWPIGTIDPYQTVDQKYLIEIQQQLTQHAMWKFPGVQLYPQSKQWTDVMLANDPVYLVAVAKGSLEHIIEQYPALYQNRLRLYATGPWEDVDRSLKFLPQNQIGYTVMWNISLYLISDYLKQYLKSIFDILRPGGVCVFNYNNCTITASAKLAENKIFAFMTPKIIKEVADEIGFENIIFKDIALEDLTYTHISWVELRKPGVLTTIKSHQPMAKIID